MKTLRDVMLENMEMDTDTIDRFLSFLDLEENEDGSESGT